MSYIRQNNFNGQFFPALNAGLRFNGVDQYVNLGQPSRLINLQEHTISCFVKINGDGTDEPTEGTIRPIFTESYGATTDRPKFILGYRDNASTEKFTYIVYDSSDNAYVLDSTMVYTLDRWYHITVTFTLNVSIKIYVNGVLENELLTPSLASIKTQPLNNLLIGRFTEGLTRSGAFGDSNRYGEFDIAHLQIFNTTLTSEQIYHIATTGGIIPQSAHSSCILNMPFQDDKYYKELTGGGGELYPITGLTQSLGDKIAFDLSTQFNYAKTTAIDAAHGQLPAAVWTDNELYVADGNNSTSLINLYGKNPAYRRVARTYDGVMDYDEISTAVGVDYNTPISVLIYFKYQNNGSNQILIFQGEPDPTSDNKRFSFVINGSTNEVSFVLANNTSNPVLDRLVITLNGKIKEGENLLIFTYGGDRIASNCYAYLNDTEGFSIIQEDLKATSIINIGTVTTIGRHSRTSTGNYFNGLIKILQITNAVEPNSIIEKASINKSFEGITSNTFLLNAKANETGNMTDYSPSAYNIVGTRSVVDDVLIGQGANVDFNSDIPVPRQGLTLKYVLGGTEKWVALDKSNLPNASDDFTIHLTFRLNETSIRSTNNIFINLYLFWLGYGFSNAVSNKRNSLTARVLLENDNLQSIEGRLSILSFEDDSVSFQHIINEQFVQLQNNTITSISVVVRNSIAYTYVNGILFESSIYTGIDFTTYNDYFTLGVDPTMEDFNFLSSPLSEQDYLSFGYWKRVLQPAEIAYLHNSGIPQTPAKILAETSTNMQDNMVIWHNFNEGDIIDNSGILEVKNYGSGANGIINGFSTITDVYNALVNINEIR